ncbi:MAG: putative ABC transport system permease protein [Candidatus Azotimanducaceae bacterium]|jgi:putative ABC transport system permease protein
MMAYHLKLAWLSFKKTPVMSSLIIGAIGLGIGVCISLLTVYVLMIKDPAPSFSDRLFTYKLNNEPKLTEGRSPDMVHPLVGYRDAMNLLKSDIPVNQSLHYQTAEVVYPAASDQSPVTRQLRLANAGFFAVHRIPFLYGTPWTDTDELSDPYQTVLTRSLNEAIFAGENSVGQSLQIGPNYYKIIGVMDNYKPMPLYLETDSGAFNEIKGALVPFSLTPTLEMRKSGGSTRCMKDPLENTFASFLETDCYWIHHWVELDNTDDVTRFKQYLDDYSIEQQQFSRHLGVPKHEVYDLISWLEDRQVVNQDYRILLSVAFLFLLVCLLNCIGLLLAKFLGKSGEISLRRAVGGSKKMIFRQYMVEVTMIGFLGGCVGLLVATIGLIGIRAMYRNYEQLTHLNLELGIIAILLAIGSTIIAGLFPVWQACRLPVSQHLKSQ